MKCPACYHLDTKVIDSRVASDAFSIRRRRECLKCNFRFSTYEEIEILDLTVIKNDGKKEPYSRDKLSAGLKKAFEKRPITNDDFKKLIGSIERDIETTNKAEVSAEQIGNIIMKHLRAVDKVAYIRFASVYKSFEDINRFAQELDKLIDKKQKSKAL
ncbi:MAG: transcriptional regulator NrdR [Candidatus Falkowbacteria bacterium]|nr:transcriptional regulator NrdR [Candidatus Falkowbacteria bacterium]